MGQASPQSYQYWAVFNLWMKILVMDLYLTVLDQDSGLKGIILNLDGEKWLLFIFVYTLVYRDGTHPFIHTHAHITSYILKFSINLRPAGWLHPGTLQATFSVYLFNSLSSPIFISSSISWSRWRPYIPCSTTVQRRLFLRIFLVFLMICLDKSQNFFNICINPFPAFLCYISIFYILSLLHMWVFKCAHVCECGEFS